MMEKEEEKKSKPAVWDRDMVGTTVMVSGVEFMKDAVGKEYAEIEIYDGLGHALWITHSHDVIWFLRDKKPRKDNPIEIDVDLHVSSYEDI